MSLWRQFFQASNKWFRVKASLVMHSLSYQRSQRRKTTHQLTRKVLVECSKWAQSNIKSHHLPWEMEITIPNRSLMSSSQIWAAKWTSVKSPVWANKTKVIALSWKRNILWPTISQRVDISASTDTPCKLDRPIFLNVATTSGFLQTTPLDNTSMPVSEKLWALAITPKPSETLPFKLTEQACTILTDSPQIWPFRWLMDIHQSSFRETELTALSIVLERRIQTNQFGPDLTSSS